MANPCQSPLVLLKFEYFMVKSWWNPQKSRWNHGEIPHKSLWNSGEFPQNSWWNHLESPDFLVKSIESYRGRRSWMRWMTWAAPPCTKRPVWELTRCHLMGFLMIFGEFWLFFDDLWLCLVIHSDLWWFLIIFGDCWWVLVIFGDCWWFWVIYGDVWWLFGDFWCLLDCWMIYGDFMVIPPRENGGLTSKNGDCFLLHGFSLVIYSDLSQPKYLQPLVWSWNQQSGEPQQWQKWSYNGMYMDVWYLHQGFWYPVKWGFVSHHLKEYPLELNCLSCSGMWNK